jgi:NSS family neurotransmitter:Na+ symporter
VVSVVFFALMTIAALTSSISMLEVPVAYTIENHGVERKTAVIGIGIAISLVSLVILLDFGNLFGAVVNITTRYSQPLLGLLYCIFCGWLWHRNSILEELRKGSHDIENTLFWRIWPWYIRYVCPMIILLIFGQVLFG